MSSSARAGAALRAGLISFATAREGQIGPADGNLIANRTLRIIIRPGGRVARRARFISLATADTALLCTHGRYINTKRCCS